MITKFNIFKKNFTFDEAKLMILFGTRRPELLSKRQKLMRIYGSFLKVSHEEMVMNNHEDSTKFFSYNQEAKEDFRKMMGLNEYDQEFLSLADKYETYIMDNIDTYTLLEDNVQYSLNSNKYYVYTDEQMMFDPFGYYSGSMPIYGSQSPLNTVYVSDFPWGDQYWSIFPDTRGELEKSGLVRDNQKHVSE